MRRMRTVAMVLAANPVDSKVIIDGHDISDMCCGVDISAHVGEHTTITLYLVADCELLADVPDVAVKQREDEPE